MIATRGRLIAIAVAMIAVQGCAPRAAVPVVKWNPAANLKPADSTCAQVLQGGRTTTDTFVFHLRIAATGNDASVTFQREVIRAILPHLLLPDTIVADFALTPDSVAWPRDSASPPSAKQRARKRKVPAPGDRGEFDALVGFNVTGDGRIDTPGVLFPSSLPALHSAFVAAVVRAHAAGAIGAAPGHLRTQEVQVRVALRRTAHDTLPSMAQVLVRFRTFTKDASRSRMVHPAYPDDLRKAGIEGQVDIAMVIDADGSIRQGSTRIITPSRPEFVEAVQRSLSGAFYNPAEYRGCPIAQQVIQPFQFSIAR